MSSPRITKGIRWTLLVGSFIGLFPFSARLADPLATRRYNSSIDTRVLLLWPDHIELRRVSTLPEVSPRPEGASYSFLIPPERQTWVKARLRNEPTGGDGGWIFRIKQLGPERQRIQLEVLGDGFWGMVYEASPEKIVPLGTRLAGPEFAFVILAIHLVCWGGLWGLVYTLNHTSRVPESIT